MSILHFKKLTKDAIIPMRAHPNDAGLDLFCNETVVINGGERALVSTGVACSFPDGYVMKIENKSGRSLTYGLLVGGGIIDSGYRGEIKVVLFNVSTNKIVLGKGEKIAQLILYPISLDEPIEVESLDETQRGIGGFGSTGLINGSYCVGCGDLDEDCCKE
jgi:dUTP pyrophosphatase